MTLNRFALTTAFVAAATLASTVSAQDRDAKKREAVRNEKGSSAQVNAPKGEARAQERRDADNQRRDAERRANDDNRRANEQRAAENARAAEQQRAGQQRAYEQQRRNDEAIRQQKRDYDGSRDVGRAVPRGSYPSYRDREEIRNEKYKDAARREYRRDQLGRYYYNPGHVYVAPRVYDRPYSFRPRFSVSVGIFAGYPVPYSWRYSEPIYVYGYRAPRAPVYIDPGASPYGGIALEIGPYDADVFVDGSYAGRVEDFDGSVQPLTLVAGTHRIEVQAPGYAPLIFDVTIQPGQVIPYRGDLRPF
jgi:hypothetical protein